MSNTRSSVFVVMLSISLMCLSCAYADMNRIGQYTYGPCLIETAKRYQVSPLLLDAIIKTESNHNPLAININTTGTEDVGLMQINLATWLPTISKHGYDRKSLFDPCTNIAVGGWVLRAEPDVGLVATQGMAVSHLWGDTALRSLAEGINAPRIVDDLVKPDAGADYRQLLVLDATGGCAAWTGSGNHDFKGHILNENLVVGGNWLANDQVLETLKSTFLASNGSMAERLLMALKQAMQKGSDSRGTLSAAIKVVSAQSPTLDLRIDNSASPVEDLITLYQKTFSSEYAEFLSRLPTLEQPYRS